VSTDGGGDELFEVSGTVYRDWDGSHNRHIRGSHQIAREEASPQFLIFWTPHLVLSPA